MNRLRRVSERLGRSVRPRSRLLVPASALLLLLLLAACVAGPRAGSSTWPAPVLPPAGSALHGWSAATAPLSGLDPASAPTQDDDVAPAVLGVSCPTPTTCVAGGEYYDRNGFFDGLLEVGSSPGGKWVWAPAVAPTTGLSPTPASTPAVDLGGMSCGSVTRCMGAGQYQDARGGYDGLLEAGVASGGTWSWKPTVAPTAGLSPSSSSLPNVDLVAVSCGSPTTCVVTGQYKDAAAGVDGLVETGTEVGGMWTWRPMAVPPGAKSAEGVFLNGVSCETATSCVAVGSGGSRGGGIIVVGTESGGSWSWVPATVPTRGLLPAAAPASVALTSVSCVSATCVAGGTYSDDHGHAEALILTGARAAGRWSWAASTPPTAGAWSVSPSTPGKYLPPEVYGVSCVTATSCLAVGRYRTASGATNGLIEAGSEVDGVWRWVPGSAAFTALGPSENGRALVLYDASCAGATCVAGGQYMDKAGDFDALLETGPLQGT